jgi:hypothetical protein
VPVPQFFSFYPLGGGYAGRVGRPKEAFSAAGSLGQNGFKINHEHIVIKRQNTKHIHN